MYPTDNLFDLRQFFSEMSQLFFINNYHFEYSGHRLNELVEISMHEYIENEAKIDVIIDPFDERSARFHLKKVQEFIQNPQAHQNVFGGVLKAIKENQAEAENAKESEPKAQTESEEKSKDQKDATTASIDKSLNLNEAIEGNLETFSKLNKEITGIAQDFKFVQSLTFSGFNPPHPHRKLRGDFFYLSIKSLEGLDHQVTACQRGFYVNNSTFRTYDPTPKDDAVFLNILDLISSVSAQCRQSLETLINADIKEENIYTKPLNLYTFEVKWLTGSSDRPPEDMNLIQLELRLSCWIYTVLIPVVSEIGMKNSKFAEISPSKI